MFDISVEQILKVKPPVRAVTYKRLMIAACAFSALFVIYAIGVLTTALMVFLTVILFRYYDAEYEYILVEKAMDVDRIMARSRRKHMGTYDFSKMEMMAPAGHGKLETYERMNCKVFNYASGYAPEKEYVVFMNSNKEMIKMILEPDERMLSALEKIAPQKVCRREENVEKKQ